MLHIHTCFNPKKDKNAKISNFDLDFSHFFKETIIFQIYQSIV